MLVLLHGRTLARPHWPQKSGHLLLHLLSSVLDCFGVPCMECKLVMVGQCKDQEQVTHEQAVGLLGPSRGADQQPFQLSIPALHSEALTSCIRWQRQRDSDAPLKRYIAVSGERDRITGDAGDPTHLHLAALPQRCCISC